MSLSTVSSSIQAKAGLGLETIGCKGHGAEVR
jgi:hypothetical protein